MVLGIVNVSAILAKSVYTVNLLHFAQNNTLVNLVPCKDVFATLETRIIGRHTLS